MSELLPEGNYVCRVDKAEKDTLKDGREILALQLVATDANGKEHRIYEVIQTQERLDQFLVSVGFPPGAMKLKVIRPKS